MGSLRHGTSVIAILPSFGNTERGPLTNSAVNRTGNYALQAVDIHAATGNIGALTEQADYFAQLNAQNAALGELLGTVVARPELPSSPRRRRESVAADFRRTAPVIDASFTSITQTNTDGRTSVSRETVSTDEAATLRWVLGLLTRKQLQRLKASNGSLTPWELLTERQITKATAKQAAESRLQQDSRDKEEAYLASKRYATLQTLLATRHETRKRKKTPAIPDVLGVNALQASIRPIL